ncbi:MAG: DegT/DnrJ/EryC1/StrS family aminotransferase, partial [Pseudanabaena sp. LacPavin_0818_WC45_MAG_42_6]|nr:DegT/DnrJ/EryC1/StrS family aminotransferase [Pseudanabaena sp. LacPavin_0818_WC45_MAG_42_6]
MQIILEKKFDVLITGGLGFIGSAITRYLLSVDKTVVCLDTADPGRLDDLDSSVHKVIGDIMDVDLMDSWISRCDRVIHLAAVVGVDEYMTRPHEVLDTGILEEESDHWYGSSQNYRWCYGISKTAGEHYAYALGRLGLTAAAVRYFNIYGAKLDAPGKGRVISKFLGCIRDGKPLTLVDGGHAVRTLCYIDDAAEATARLALELSPECSFNHSAVNIGRSEPMTVRELAEMMIRLSGHKAGTVEVKGTEFFGKGFEEIPLRVPNVSKLARVLNFKAKIEPEEGLRRTLDYWGLLARDVPTTITPSSVATQQIIPMVKPHFAPDDALMQSFHKSLVTGQTTNGGPHLSSFEKELSDYLGVPDVVVLSNGADALTLGLKALNRQGKAVLPSYTFIATLNSIVAAGLEPVFCDIDPETFTMSPTALGEILDREDNIACVVPVNVFGVPADLAAISELCQTVGAEIVYDNC